MQLIDTHAHIYLDVFNNDIDQVVQRAAKNGISKIILPNIDSKTINRLHSLYDAYPEQMIPLMGLHPTHVKKDYKKELDIILQQLHSFSYKGIGEIGIDLYWDTDSLEEQIAVFRRQLEMALQLNLPVVIHARNSFNEILNIVKKKEFEGITGIFHAFTGDLSLAREITSMGFMLGIGGILTFKNSNLSEVVKEVDLEHIVLETDSPYLAPVPYRGKRNESSYLIHTAQKLAEIKGLAVDEVGEITTCNVKELFKI